MATARVGISGWTYAPWRGEFYPTGLRQADELGFVAERLNSIELNGSFYSLQKPASWLKWRSQTPDGFAFSVKVPRFITHMRRLDDIAEPLANFFASGVLGLGPKLGPFLWQLPPNLDYDPDLIATLFARLPRDTEQSLATARGRGERMRGKELLEIDAVRPVRHAIEPRAHSFDDQQFADQAAEAGVAVVLGDSAGRWPRLDWLTADFAYARLHGDTELYTSGYDAAALDEWEEWTRDHLDHDRDVYVYFDNDVKVRAPFDAMELTERLQH